jgi:hypothetical protein
MLYLGPLEAALKYFVAMKTIDETAAGKLIMTINYLKGTVSRDFRPSVF